MICAVAEFSDALRAAVDAEVDPLPEGVGAVSLWGVADGGGAAVRWELRTRPPPDVCAIRPP